MTDDQTNKTDVDRKAEAEANRQWRWSQYWAHNAGQYG